MQATVYDSSYNKVNDNMSVHKDSAVYTPKHRPRQKERDGDDCRSCCVFHRGSPSIVPPRFAAVELAIAMHMNSSTTTIRQHYII